VDRVVGAVVDDVTALYLNVLVVPPGGAVERHVDATLGVVAGDPRTIVPRVVVALYVDVPADLQGGVLRLDRDGVAVAEITPRRGRLVCFDGRLAHEVTATTASGPRVSCVAELYRLPRERLRALPRLRVQSNGFADVLERLRSG
jgi:predicted 2-oxoglutarate/Fe(II)-dependent dioxygenase YbiX